MPLSQFTCALRVHRISRFVQPEASATLDSQVVAVTDPPCVPWSEWSSHAFMPVHASHSDSDRRIAIEDVVLSRTRVIVQYARYQDSGGEGSYDSLRAVYDLNPYAALRTRMDHQNGDSRLGSRQEVDLQPASPIPLYFRHLDWSRYDSHGDVILTDDAIITQAIDTNA